MLIILDFLVLYIFFPKIFLLIPRKCFSRIILENKSTTGNMSDPNFEFFNPTILKS